MRFGMERDTLQGQMHPVHETLTRMLSRGIIWAQPHRQRRRAGGVGGDGAGEPVPEQRRGPSAASPRSRTRRMSPGSREAEPAPRAPDKPLRVRPLARAPLLEGVRVRGGPAREARPLNQGGTADRPFRPWTEGAFVLGDDVATRGVQALNSGESEGKRMTDKLSKTYNPAEHEERLYRWWEERGFFRPEKQVELGLVAPGGPRWCITMPPPNVTGVLHLGHAMTAAVEDLHDPLLPHAGRPDALPARYRPRRHRHAERGGARAAQGGADPPRPGPRDVRRARAGSGSASRHGASPTSTSGWGSRATGSASASRSTRT